MVDPLKVDFRVSEVYLPHLRLGLRVHVTVDARPGEAIEGEIVAVDPIVDGNGRAVRLRARVRNPDGRLSAGMFARIRIVVDKNGRASCRKRVCSVRVDLGGSRSLNKTRAHTHTNATVNLTDRQH